MSGILTGKKGEILAANSADSDLYDMFSHATRKQFTWISKRLSMRHKTQKKRFYEQIITYEGSAPAVVSIYWDYSNSVDSGLSAGTAETNIVRKDLSKENHRLIKTLIQADANGTTEVDSIGYTFRRFVKLIDQNT